MLSGLCFFETNTSKYEAAFAFAEIFNTLLKAYDIKDRRDFISINGKSFKERGHDTLIEFLAEHITPEVETIVRSSSRVATYEYLPPQGMTYDHLLDLRKEYKIIFEMLSWWFS